MTRIDTNANPDSTITIEGISIGVSTLIGLVGRSRSRSICAWYIQDNVPNDVTVKDIGKIKGIGSVMLSRLNNHLRQARAKAIVPKPVAKAKPTVKAEPTAREEFFIRFGIPMPRKLNIEMVYCRRETVAHRIGGSIFYTLGVQRAYAADNEELVAAFLGYVRTKICTQHGWSCSTPTDMIVVSGRWR